MIAVIDNYQEPFLDIRETLWALVITPLINLGTLT